MEGGRFTLLFRWKWVSVSPLLALRHRCDGSERAGGIFRHGKRSRQYRPGLLIDDFTHFRRQAACATRGRRVEVWRSLPYAGTGQSNSVSPHRENELLEV